MADNKPITIDNVGIETSRRYAQNAAVDKKVLVDAATLSNVFGNQAITPYPASDFEEKFLGADRKQSFASIEAPEPLSQDLFRFSIFPGDKEKVQSQIEQLKNEPLLDFLKFANEIDRNIEYTTGQRNKFFKW